MEFSLIQSILSLNLIEITILSIVGTVIFYISLSRRIHILMFTLVLSASLVGSTIPVMNNIAALFRWLSIFLLLIVAILQGRWRVSLGYVLFWGYVGFGFISLFRAINSNWQLQRCILLLLVAVAIPCAYSIERYKSFKLSLVSISVAATFFSILCFISLPGQLSEAARFSGVSKGAPTFALVLGGLLPFTFWGLWKANWKAVKIACGLGFLFGVAVLIFSGQRTGTVAGVIGLIPLLIAFQQGKTIGWSVLLVILLASLGYFLVQQSSLERVNFLQNRYSLDSGLTGRELIWDNAFSQIEKNPFLGRGIGAAETVIFNSFHNTYLEVWFNTGIFGLLMFLASQLYFSYRIVYLNRISKNPDVKSFLVLALGYMLGFIVICMFESTGAGASNVNLILYLFIGALVSNNDLDNYTQPSNSRNSILHS